MGIGCAKKEAPKPKAPAGPQDQTQSAEPVKHKVLSFNLEGLTEKGAKKWGIQGKTAESISGNRIQLDNIVAKSYGDQAEAVITADKGIYDRSGNTVTLKENVKATIENAYGITGDLTDLASDKKPAARESTVSNEKPKKTRSVITCDGDAQFDYEKNEAYFNRNVKIKSDDGDIDADRITVYLDPATKRVNQIVAEGNVKITRGENVTYSEKATYIEAEKKIVLSGAPRLVIYHEGGELEDDFLGR